MNYYLVTYHYRPNSEVEHSDVVAANNPLEASEQVKDPKYGTRTITAIKMITNPETSYTVLKNHLHNTLELTKSDIRKMVEEAIEEIVERRLDVFLEYKDGIERVIDAAIREKSWSSLLLGDSKKLDEKLQDKIVQEVTAKLLNDIGLDVTIKRKK